MEIFNSTTFRNNTQFDKRKLVKLLRDTSEVIIQFLIAILTL